MNFKKLPFAYLIFIPLVWFFFRLLPAFTHPSDFSTPNFIYAENFDQLRIWCFDAHSNIRFDDSSNFLFAFFTWALVHFLQFPTIKAVMVINAFSMFLSLHLLHKIIDSRFWSVHLLLTGLLFMSTQIWAGVLGDEIIFQGMLWLLVVHAFWKHRYLWLMVFSALNIIARPDNILIVMPFIIMSYLDYADLKERDKRKFIFRRIRRTFNFFIVPLAAYFTYRFIYFGKIMPFNWLHHSLETDRMFGLFNLEAGNFLRHYIRHFTLPLWVGIVFYFIKDRKRLHARYYTIAMSLLIIPMLYSCTFTQDENLAFKNYYAVYLGLIILSLLFIRDFRSISQGFTTGIFVLFFGFPIAFNYFQKTLQSYNDNQYYIANDLAQIHNGKAIVYYDNFISWTTEWQVTFASGKHTKKGHKLTTQELSASQADLIITDNRRDIDALKDKYNIFLVPKNTRQYEKETEPDNSLDKFFYKYSHKLPIDRMDYFTMMVWEFGSNYADIKDILVAHGAKEVK